VKTANRRRALMALRVTIVALILVGLVIGAQW
jgi:hypothetical protein